MDLTRLPPPPASSESRSPRWFRTFAQPDAATVAAGLRHLCSLGPCGWLVTWPPSRSTLRSIDGRHSWVCVCSGRLERRRCRLGVEEGHEASPTTGEPPCSAMRPLLL